MGSSKLVELEQLHAELNSERTRHLDIERFAITVSE